GFGGFSLAHRVSARGRPRGHTRAAPRQHAGPSPGRLAAVPRDPALRRDGRDIDGVIAMKRAIAALAGLVALSASTLPSHAETIKLATLAPKDSPYYDILRDMGEAWREASGGRIELRIYPDGVAGDESDVVRKMRVGQLQASAMSGGGLTDIVPEYR